MIALPPALAPLARWRRFILFELRTRADGRTDKVPLHHATLVEHSAHDPANHLSFDEAAAWFLVAGTSNNRRFGVGFSFSEADPFFFLDVDHCIDAAGQWSEMALWALRSFPDAAVEISQSGQGLHVIGSYTSVPPHRSKRSDLGLELYHEERFVALTGNCVGTGTADAECTDRLAALVASTFARGDVVAGGGDDWQDGPDPAWNGPSDDEAIVAYARTHPAPIDAATAFTGGGARPSFEAAWTGDLGPWAGDASSADYYLAFELAKLTGFDCPRVARILVQSGVRGAGQGKYQREDYVQMTVRAGVAAARGAARWPKQWWPQPVQAVQAVVAEPAAPGGWADPTRGPLAGVRNLGSDQVPAYLTGYRWIAALDEIVDPRGILWSQPQFNHHHAGRSFMLPTTKETSKAWDAAMVYVPHVDRPEFDFTRPFYSDWHEQGQHVINLAKLPTVAAAPGAVWPFFRHLKRLFPDRDKRRIFLYWAIHAVQRRGHVLGWAPVIQGVPGNGKSSLVDLVSYAVGEEVTYSFDIHKTVRAGSIGFNAYMAKNVLMIASEPKLAESRDALNVLKPLVTDRWLVIEPKGKDPFKVRNHLVWVVTTNFKNGIPIEPGERRWAPLFTAQQNEEDIDKDAVAAFWAWTQRPEVQAAVSWWLQRARVRARLACDPGWDGTRAPRTPDTVEAMHESRGAWEEEIAELIEQGEPGFKGGWVSSMAIKAHVPRMRARTVATTMQMLGYVLHPALDGTQGRCTLITSGGAPSDVGKKPRLYLRKGNPALVLLDRDAVRDAYVQAQGAAADAPVPFQRVPRPESVFGPDSVQPIGPESDAR